MLKHGYSAEQAAQDLFCGFAVGRNDGGLPLDPHAPRIRNPNLCDVRPTQVASENVNLQIKEVPKAKKAKQTEGSGSQPSNPAKKSESDIAMVKGEVSKMLGFLKYRSDEQKNKSQTGLESAKKAIEAAPLLKLVK